MTPTPLANTTLVYLAEEDPTRTGSHWLAVVQSDCLVDMAAALLAEGYHLEDVSGLEVCEAAVSVYHFDHFTSPGRITVLVTAPYQPDGAVFPSIASVYQGAEWHERETRDFYGFTYTGNPNLIPLLMPDDMAHVHPLQKDEAARVPLHVIFNAENRGSRVLKKADGFTLLDIPPAPETAQEKPAPAAATAAEKQPVQQAAIAATPPVAEKAPALAPLPAPVKEQAMTEPAPTSKPEPIAEAKAAAPKTADKSAPAAKKTVKKKTPGKGGKK